MKRRNAAFLIAAALMLQPATIYAAPSTSARPTATQSDNRDRNISKDYHMTDFKGSGASGGSTAGGTTPGISVVSPGGTGVAGGTGTAGGQAGTGAGADTGAGTDTGVSLTLGVGPDPIATGLAADVVEDINTINSGTQPLYRTIGTADLVGYSALTPVTTVVATEAAVKDPQTGKVALTVYVPNLLEGLNEVQILYYNKATHQWERVTPAAIDYATKQITLNVDDGTPFTVIYKSKN